MGYYNENPEEGTVEDRSDKSYPIRLMFAISHRFDDGFSVIYELRNGTACQVNIWYSRENFGKVRFTDEGESRIVLTWYEKKGGWLVDDIAEWRVKEVIIRRDAQLPAHRK